MCMRSLLAIASRHEAEHVHQHLAQKKRRGTSKTASSRGDQGLMGPRPIAPDARHPK